MPLGPDLVGGDEHPLPLFGHFGEADVPRFRDPPHQLLGATPPPLRVFVHVGHQHAGLVPHERHREERLDPRLQPAMIEMVPVGATVVTLQLRSRCIGRIRLPS